MSKRLTFADDKAKPGGLKGLLEKGKVIGTKGIAGARWVAQKTGKTGWIVLTTAVVTIFPLVFEIHREAQTLEQEKLHIKVLLSEGKTRQEIAMMGYTSAIDPNVLGPEASS